MRESVPELENIFDLTLESELSPLTMLRYCLVGTVDWPRVERAFTARLATKPSVCTHLSFEFRGEKKTTCRLSATQSTCLFDAWNQCMITPISEAGMAIQKLGHTLLQMITELYDRADDQDQKQPEPSDVSSLASESSDEASFHSANS